MYINTFSTLTFSSHFNVVKYSFFSYYLLYVLFFSKNHKKNNKYNSSHEKDSIIFISAVI